MIVSNPLEHGLPYAAIALNSQLPKYFDKVWKQANIRICVDGGANKIWDIQDHDKDHDILAPDAVVGDIKTIRPEIKHEFELAGTQFVDLKNQNFTDAEKAINLLSEMKCKNPILLLGAFDGRFDQTAAEIHSALSPPDLSIILADDSNFSNWIFPGRTKILTPQKVTTNVCGLLPLLKPVSLKTKGLRWNLNGQTLAMGKFISSSNEVAAKEVTIDTKVPIFWTLQAKKVIEIQKKAAKK